MTKGMSHGYSYTVEYSAWQNMISRCHRKTATQYKDYGARGIIVCQEWRDSFLAFYNHVGPKPEGDYSLDRIENDKNYEPGNVRWASRLEQENNKRGTVKITAFGETKALNDWCREKNVSAQMVYKRLKRGWNPEDALTQGSCK